MTGTRATFLNRENIFFGRLFLNMYFELLFTIFLINGFFCAVYPEKAVLIFIVLSVIVPTSAAFSGIAYSNGLFIVDAFFFSLIAVIFFEIAITRKSILKKGDVLALSLLLLIYIPYIYLLLTSSDFEIKFIKELRPLLLSIESLIFFIYIRKINLQITFSSISIIAIVASLSNIIYYSILYLEIFVPFDYYYVSNSYRYLDLSTYFSVYFIFHYFFINERRKVPMSSLNIISLNLSILSVIISNSRFIVFSLFMALLIVNVSNYKIFVRRILQGALIMSLLLLYSYMIGATRVTGSLQVDKINLQLYTRYVPALKDIYRMKNSQKIFGYGLGHYFEIPWFYYREQVENSNISVDCAYLTSYVKQGIFGIIALFLVTTLLVKASQSKLKAALYIFWGCMFVVSASFYQIFPFGAVVYSAFLIKDEVE